MEKETRPQISIVESNKEKKELQKNLLHIWRKLASAEERREHGVFKKEYPRESFLIDGKKIAFSFAFKDEQKIFELKNKELSDQNKPVPFKWSREYKDQFYSGILGVSIADHDSSGEKRKDLVIQIKNGVCKYGLKDFLITPDTDRPPAGTRDWKLEIFTMPDLHQPPSYYKAILRDDILPYEKSELRDFKDGEVEEIKNLVDKMAGHIWDRGHGGW